MNYLPYYLPLIKEINQRNNQIDQSSKDQERKLIPIRVFLEESNKKFTNPLEKKHLQEIEKYSQKYCFQIYNLLDLSKYPGPTFFCEGNIVGQSNKSFPQVYQYLTSKHLKISLVSNFEFFIFQDQYYRLVDYIIYPNPLYSKFYGKETSKNLYLGSPKYDSETINNLLSREEIIAKYGLDLDKKYILIIYPKNPTKHKKKNRLYPSSQSLKVIYQTIRKLGYQVIVKNRKQDTFEDIELKGDYYLEDLDYQVTNSMELIKISELVIYFSSSINEECLALKTPYIDIKVDLERDRFPFYNQKDYSYVIDYNMLFQVIQKKESNKLIISRIKDILEKLIKSLLDRKQMGKIKWDNQYQQIFEKYNQNSSKKIVDYFLRK